MSTLPIIAVTMGDGAGVGPEISVAAAMDAGLAVKARIVIVGDADRLREAARIMGLGADIQSIADVDDYLPGRVNVIDLGLLPADLLEAAVEAGRHQAVRTVDVVEVDATADPTGVTVDLAAMCLLSVAAGFAAR